MNDCTHIWISYYGKEYIPSEETILKNANELECKRKGLWVRVEEKEIVEKLVNEGKLKYCNNCYKKAVFPL